MVEIYSKNKIMSSRIIRFLRNQGTDHKGRTLKQIRDLPDHKIEREHDIIQWMFPTDLPSSHCKDAPTLTDEDIERIKEDTLIQDNIEESLDRMIRFYEKNDYWITQKNHNFLRITRILRCLWLSNRIHDYVCLSRVLDDIYIYYHEIIGEETYYYWKYANDREYLKCPTIKFSPGDKLHLDDNDFYNYV